MLQGHRRDRRLRPECLTILTGGEPLLRRDILEIVRRAAERGLWVVVGTNGVRITENVAQHLAEAGARGLSLSLDALDPDRHDRFRNVRGAWQNTVEGAGILNRAGLPFIVQTTAGSHNARRTRGDRRLRVRPPRRESLEPLFPGAHRARAVRLGHHPAQYDDVLASLYRIQGVYQGRMLVNAKCAPHYIKTVLETSLTTPRPDGLVPAVRYQDLLRWRRRLPGGHALPGDPPERRRHAVPLPAGIRGILRSTSLTEVWTSSELFTGIRRRASLGGRCGACEMNAQCGGCRARAYGMTGDLMAEDPLCTHTPGKFAGAPLLTALPAGASRDRVRSGIAGHHRVGRCGQRAHEEDPRVRAGDGRQGRRGVLPQERPRPRDRRRARADPRADADP